MGFLQLFLRTWSVSFADTRSLCAVQLVPESAPRSLRATGLLERQQISFSFLTDCALLQSALGLSSLSHLFLDRTRDTFSKCFVLRRIRPSASFTECNSLVCLLLLAVHVYWSDSLFSDNNRTCSRRGVGNQEAKMALPTIDEGSLAGMASAPPPLLHESAGKGFFSVDTRCVHSLFAPLQDARCFAQVGTGKSCYFRRDVRCLTARLRVDTYKKLLRYHMPSWPPPHLKLFVGSSEALRGVKALSVLPVQGFKFTPCPIVR